MDHLAATNELRLAIGLPLRNREALTNLLHDLSNPASARFRRYLTPSQFTAAFGPTAQDYQAVIGFAQANGLAVSGTHPNRLLVDLHGKVADVEKVFHVGLQVYPHPTEARTFYAPSSEPSVDLNTPLLHISGLDNYTTPRPMSLRETDPSQTSGAKPRLGTGPGGQFRGSDFRTAYVPGTSLTGIGQVVGLFELNGYYATDITAYETQTGLPHVTLQNVLIDGFNGSAGGRRPGSANEEVALDIEMAISMAPGLSKVMVYEGSPAATAAVIDDILNRMATDNAAQQLSCSWGFDIDEMTQQIFLQYAAQGQSFYMAGGDTGAFTGAVAQPSDDPYITVVGGTTLTTDSGQNWISETTWNNQSNGGAGGGGISTIYPIPDWQQGIDMSANHGSATMRNLPDVAMVADNVWIIADNGRSVTVSGTSIAAPLWAGLTALINEQAAAQGKPVVGFINPAVYRVGKGPNYAATFHDIITGNNSTTGDPTMFPAVPGFDLCTGWGTPNGTNLINALLEEPTAGLVITSPLGFLASGPIGGPFTVSSANFTLTNAGTSPLTWDAVLSDPGWLNLGLNSGTLAAGGSSTTVTVSLSTNASSLLIGSYSANVSFNDLSHETIQTRPITLSVGNGDFETGDFTDWTFSGQSANNFADSVDFAYYNGASNLPGVDDSAFVHSGIYGAFLGQNTSLGYLTQTLPTVAGRRYVLSFWVANPGGEVANNTEEFAANWGGTPMVDLNNPGQFGWTNMSYLVTATSSSTALRFAFRNDQNAFALDDVSVLPVPAPQLESAPKFTDAGFTMTWSVVSHSQYQLEYADDLNSGVWMPLGARVASSTSTVTLSDPMVTAPHRFYRLVLQP